MKKTKSVILFLLLLICLFAFSGCATMGVHVWERDILAKPSMSLERNIIEREMDDHIYFSKEGSSGGRGFGGGGCGCN